MNALFFEKWYPYLLGLIAGIIWFELNPCFPSTDAILSATLTVSGIFVGFLATSKAILISMNSGLIGDLKKSGYIKDLVSYMGQAIWLNLVFCTFNVIGFFDIQKTSWFPIIWVTLSVIALMTFVRVTHIMLQIFKHG